MTTTTDLASFGYRELAMVRDLLTTMLDQGLPKDFSGSGVHPMMNTSSGNVFLTNEDYEVAMMNGDKLESFYSSPYEGREGFFDELLAEYDQMHHEDQEWFRNVADNIGRTDELPKINDDQED